MSFILPWTCIGFLLGVAGFFLEWEAVAFAGVICFGVIVSIFSEQVQKRKAFSVLFLIAGLAGGYFWSLHYQSTHVSKLPAEFFNKKVTVVGVVTEDPDRGLAGTKMVVKPLSVDGRGMSFLIFDHLIIRLKPPRDFSGTEDGEAAEGFRRLEVPEISYGDKISISGVLERPESFITETEREFDYPGYLALHDIFGIINVYDVEVLARHQGSRFLEALYSVKKFFVATITEIFPLPESGLFAGIIIGEKSLLPKENLADFQMAGLTHMIVLSGYNITIIALFMMTMFAWFGFGYRAKRVGAIVAIPVFIIMTGMGSSSVRAGIMSVIVFLLQITTRPAQSFRVIILTLTAMVLVNPRALLSDPSLHLSFLAFVGLVYVAPILAKKCENLPELFGMRDLATETLGVQIFVLPYILWMNGTVSLLLFLANLITVPIVPLVMGSGFIATLFGMIWHPLGAIIAVPAKLALSYIIFVAHKVAEVSALTFTIPPFGVLWMVLVYVAIVGCLAWWHKKPKV